MKWFVSILVGLMALVNIAMAFFFKGIKQGEKNEQTKNKAELLDEFIKVDKEIRDHIDDPIDDVLKRMSKRADR